MRAFLVSHTHWDREWYRTFRRSARASSTRSIASSISSRPTPAFASCSTGRRSCSRTTWRSGPGGWPSCARASPRDASRSGRGTCSPTRSCPSGEAHVRNLLEGRRAGAAFGPVSRVAYTPDSFGHPAQFPQLFAGFGLRAFVYWRGNGNEIDDAPAGVRLGGARRQCAPRLPPRRGLLRRRDRSARRRGDGGRPRGRRREGARGAHAERRVLLMNGIDHALPEPKTAAIAEAREPAHRLRRASARCSTTSWAPWRRRAPAAALRGRARRRARLASAARCLVDAPPDQAANRACETGLERLGRAVAALAERCSARPTSARRCASRGATLLQNQAHDSICGCSLDGCTTQMERALRRMRGAGARDDDARARAASRAGRRARAPWSDELDLAVLNPSPSRGAASCASRSTRSRGCIPAGDRVESIHPLPAARCARPGFTVDGAPARLVAGRDRGRVMLLAERAALRPRVRGRGRAGVRLAARA